MLVTEPFRYRTYLILNPSDTRSVWYWIYQIPNLLDTKPLRYQASYTEHFRYQTSLILNLSDTKPLRYWTCQILNIPHNKGQPFSPIALWRNWQWNRSTPVPSSFPAQNDHQPLLTRTQSPLQLPADVDRQPLLMRSSVISLPPSLRWPPTPPNLLWHKFCLLSNCIPPDGGKKKSSILKVQYLTSSVYN